MNLLAIFITGLSIGGLSCLAVQGGLLASLVAKNNSRLVTPAFLIAKFIAYSLLGLLLGGFGSVFSLHPLTQTYLQLAAGVYMIAVGLNLLEVHPIFRYVVITPPRFLTRLVKDQSRSSQFYAPLLLGALTIFVPCGTTLAVEALAISSGNPLTGMLTMATFTLGTFPLFLGVGFVSNLLGKGFQKGFLTVAAMIVMFLGLASINGSLVALGVPFAIGSSPSISSKAVTAQNVVINITNSGYSPRYIKAKSGVPLTLKLTNAGAYSCASAFRIPSQNIAKNILPGQTEEITFTPKKPGKITFTCSMGMYTGVIEVI